MSAVAWTIQIHFRFGVCGCKVEALAAVLENKKSPRDDAVPAQEIKAWK